MRNAMPITARMQVGVAGRQAGGVVGRRGCVRGSPVPGVGEVKGWGQREGEGRVGRWNGEAAEESMSTTPTKLQQHVRSQNENCLM